MPAIKIVIVEDLEEVTEGLSEFIRRDSSLQLLGAFRTAEAALLELPLLKPDIVIMDINLPGMTGIECIRQIKKTGITMQFMMFTVYENNDQVFEALKAGASGYLLKKTAPLQIMESIRELYEGGSPMSAAIARKLVSVFVDQNKVIAAPEAAVLTPREKEVLELVGPEPPLARLVAWTGSDGEHEQEAAHQATLRRPATPVPSLAPSRSSARSSNARLPG